MSWICGHLARCLSCYGCRMAGFCGEAPKVVSSHQPRDCRERSYDPPPESYAGGVRVLSYNVQMLLFHADSARAAAIARKILEEDVHVVCLQEAFSEGARRTLTRGLRARFPFYISRAGYKGACGLGEDSGLMVFSRFPIVRTKYTLFSSCRWCLSDSMASKGFVRVDVRVGRDVVRVYNTHLYADILGVEDRVSQLDALAFDMDQTPEDLRHCVIVGDFNVSGESEEYYGTLRSAELGTAAWADVWRLLHPHAAEDPGYTCEPPPDDGGGGGDGDGDTPEMESERLDYCFDVFRTLVWHKAEVRRMDCLSDHYALLTSFSCPAARGAGGGADAVLEMGDVESSRAAFRRLAGGRAAAAAAPAPPVEGGQGGRGRTIVDVSVEGGSLWAPALAGVASSSRSAEPHKRVGWGPGPGLDEKAGVDEDDWGAEAGSETGGGGGGGDDDDVDDDDDEKDSERPALRRSLSQRECSNLRVAHLRRLQSARAEPDQSGDEEPGWPGGAAAGEEPLGGHVRTVSGSPSVMSFQSELAHPTTAIARGFKIQVAQQTSAYAARHAAAEPPSRRRVMLQSALRRAEVLRRKIRLNRENPCMDGCCIVRPHGNTRKHRPTDIFLSMTRLPPGGPSDPDAILVAEDRPDSPASSSPLPSPMRSPLPSPPRSTAGGEAGAAASAGTGAAAASVSAGEGDGGEEEKRREESVSESGGGGDGDGDDDTPRPSFDI